MKQTPCPLILGLGTLVLLAFSAIPVNCFAHYQRVHMAITEAAAKSSTDGLQGFLKETLGERDAPFDYSPSLAAHPPPDDHYSASGYPPMAWLKGVNP